MSCFKFLKLRQVKSANDLYVDGENVDANNATAPQLTAGSSAQKKTGLRKWLKSTSSKKKQNTLPLPKISSSPAVVTNEAPPRSPNLSKQKKDKTAIKHKETNPLQESNVKHLIIDDNEQEEDGGEFTHNLPPPMEIVKINNDNIKPSTSNNSVLSESSNGEYPQLNHSQSNDLRREMEDLICEKFPNETNNVVANGISENASPVEAISEEKKKEILQKRQYVVMELVETEKDYVTDLGIIVNEFMADTLETGLPDPDKGKERVVFGNIQQIQEWHKEVFSVEIAKCLENPQLLGKLFKKYERRLHMYVKYCRNKPLSEYLVMKHKTAFFIEIQQKYKRKLDIGDYLIKPVQRIMKYQLLLKDILKYSERAQLDCTDLKAAVHIMHVVPKLANDMMMFARMKGFDVRIEALGKLLLQETFLVKEDDPGSNSTGSAKERKLFLFEHMVVFSELVDKRSEDKGFLYKYSAKTINLSLSEVHHDDNKFRLMTMKNDRKNFEISHENSNVVENWVKTVKGVLEAQSDFLKALQDPIQNLRNANNNNNHNSFELNSTKDNSSGNLNWSEGDEADNASLTTALNEIFEKNSVQKSTGEVDFSSSPWSKTSIIRESTILADDDNQCATTYTNNTSDNIPSMPATPTHHSSILKPYSSSPVKTSDGVMKLPPLTIPLDSISQSHNGNKPLSKFSPRPITPSHLISPSKDSSVFIESSPKINRTFKSPLRSFSNVGSSTNIHEPATPTFPQTPNRRYSMKSPSISSDLDSYYNSSPKSLCNFPDNYSRNKAQDTVSVKSAPVISRLSVNGKEEKKSSKNSKGSKPSSKNPNISEREMERRRGRAKHRSIPSFFKKRSKTTEGKSDRSKSRSSSKKRSESPSDIVAMQPLRSHSRQNGLHHGDPSKTSLDSFHSSKSTPCRLGSEITSSSSINSMKKESFWMSPLSPALKPGAFDVFQYPTLKKNKDSPSKTDKTEKKSSSSLTVMAVKDYKAKKEDEIAITQGDVVQILAGNATGMCLVHRPKTAKSPASEGWIPSSVLGHTSDTLKIRKTINQAEGAKETETIEPNPKKDRAIGPRSRRRLKKQNAKLSQGHSLGNLDKPDHYNADRTSIISAPSLHNSSSSESLSGKLSDLEDSISVLPKFIKPPNNYTISENQPVTLCCKICGKPRPSVSWLGPNNQEIIGNNRISIDYLENIATLHISRCVPRDNGKYACIITNQHGSTTAYATVTVKSVPNFVSKPNVDKNTPGILIVSWKAPDHNGNLPLSGYVLEYTNMGNKKWHRIEITDPQTTIKEVTNLKAGVMYQFRVKARNEHGESLPSEVSLPAVLVPDRVKKDKDQSLIWHDNFESRYECVRAIGKGRYGVVQLIQDLSYKSVFAAKFVSKRLKSKESMETEVTIANMLASNETFVGIKEMFQTPLTFILVGPYISGGQLLDYLCECQSVTEAFIKGLVRQILLGFVHMHGLDIVHLDIKPENILIDCSSNEPRIRITDFGSAAALSGDLSNHQLDLDSQEFSSPELLTKHIISISADIWLFGKSPFFMPDVEATVQNIVGANYTHPSLHASLNEGFEFIQELLVVNHNDRPSALQCMNSKWIKTKTKSVIINTKDLSLYYKSRKHAS